MRRLVCSALMALACAAASPLHAQTPPPTKPPSAEASAWKPFQEFNFLLGSWSGTAESNGRLGGRVVRLTLEMGGNFVVHRGSTIFAAQGGAPEESTEDVGYYFYDRDKRKYVALFLFSTGVVSIYDVDFPSPNSLRCVSSQVSNYEPGSRTRLLVSKASETELTFQMDIAQPGKEFVPYITSKLTKR